jgi:hypothetical protein
MLRALAHHCLLYYGVHCTFCRAQQPRLLSAQVHVPWALCCLVILYAQHSCCCTRIHVPVQIQLCLCRCHASYLHVCIAVSTVQESIPVSPYADAGGGIADHCDSAFRLVGRFGYLQVCGPARMYYTAGVACSLTYVQEAVLTCHAMPCQHCAVSCMPKVLPAIGSSVQEPQMPAAVPSSVSYSCVACCKSA